MSDEAKEAIARNVQRVMNDDGPPRLRYDMELCVIAKDTVKGYTLLGGLGPFGTGRMWEKTKELHSTLPGWNDAPKTEYVPPKPKDKK